MPSGSKKRKAAKKKKELGVKDQSNSPGEEESKREDGSESLNLENEHVELGRERGLHRSSSSSSSSSSSEEKISAVDKEKFVIDNAPAVELTKDTETIASENLPETEACNSTEGTPMVLDLDKAEPPKDTDNVTSHTDEPAVVKEIVEEKLGIVDERATVSEVLVEVEKRIDEASAALHDGTKATPTIENDDKLELSYNAPAVDASVHPDTREPYDRQRPVALAPRPVETTSWKSCCGLFEVFAGSNR